MYPSLKTCLLADSDSLSALGHTIETPHGPLTHIDNGGNILAVVHRDFVHWNDKPKIRTNSVRKCPQLDDRLGLYAILNELPKCLEAMGGIKFDVLITDSEESGESTAQYFSERFDVPDYNWMFQFDRAGADVVLYDYDTPENSDRLRDFGFQIGLGSFTDICSLESLGVAGWNIGTGYHQQHTQNCYADLGQLSRSVDRFSQFIEQYHDEKIPHIAPKIDEWGYPEWNDSIEQVYCPDRNTHFPTCSMCGWSLTWDDFICPSCHQELV